MSEISPRLQKTKETWQLITMCDSGLSSGEGTE